MKVLSEVRRKILEQNEIFLKSSPQEKRVLIARDCIAWLKSKIFTAKIGTVCEFEDVDYLGVELTGMETQSINLQLQDFLLKGSDLVGACNVCAKGALFLSYVGRVNEFKLGDLENDTDHNSNEMQKLLELFDEEQLILIETAFEGYQVVDFATNETAIELPGRKKPKKFYDKYPDSGDRLLAICKNIIRNKGIFKP